MKKELVIEMEEECIICPNLTLETVNAFGDPNLKFHQCKYIGFCKVVKKNWERFQPNCDDCDREESGPFGRSNY